MIQAETLDLLEWHRLCHHLSTFAATKLGAVASRHLEIPQKLAESQFLLAQTKEAYLLEQRLAAGLSFEGIADIGESLQRAQLQGILSGQELLEIATTLAGMRRIRRVIDEQPDLEVLNQMVAEIRTYPEIEQEIHRCIDDRGDVADRASVKLAGIRQSMRQYRERIYEILQNTLQRHNNAVAQSIITQRSDRFVIPVKATHKDVIPGIVHDTSSTGATLYVEPHSIVSLGNQLRAAQRQEQAESEAIRQALTAQVAEVQEDLEQLLAVATALDLATAKARYSLWLEANPPRFVEFGTGETPETITLRNLRHPLLVWQQKHEHGKDVIPVDLLIHPRIRVVTITGPNTGGKTVTLKTLGLAALMAKVGLFVPAREPVELPWFEMVLADIGDEQSLEQSLSTFSGHIRRISRILEALGDAENPAAALVLLDEVGAGTDPAEGSALAIALLKYLSEHALLTIATTHFGELKALKYQDDQFENASVEFDDVSLSPTYRLLWGIPGRSNALTIARRLGLNAEVVEQAQTYVGGASEDVNQVIAGLEAQRRSQEAKAKEAEALLQQAEKFYQEVSRKATQLQEREQNLKLSQEKAVTEAILQARGEIAQVIRRLQQQGNPTAQDAHQATAEVKEIAERFIPKVEPKRRPGFKPKMGDRIRIPRLGQTAEVLSEVKEDGTLNVRFGIMKMTVALEDIESLDGQKPEPVAKKAPKPQESEPKPTAEPASQPAIRTSKNTVDIRGSRVADAEPMLERAIQEALSTGMLWIVHGKGTGKLRDGVHEFLKHHPQISRFELATQAEGGTGVTVAHLK